MHAVCSFVLKVWWGYCAPDDRSEAGAVGWRGHFGHVDANGAAEETGGRAHHQATKVQEDGVGGGSLLDQHPATLGHSG